MLSNLGNGFIMKSPLVRFAGWHVAIRFIVLAFTKRSGFPGDHKVIFGWAYVAVLSVQFYFEKRRKQRW